MPSDHESSNDVTILDDDVIDEDTPFNAEHDAGERPRWHVAGELTADTFTYRLERFLRVGTDQWLEFKPGDGLREIRHDGDDLCTGNNLKKCLDD
jgi:hypothetical protein